MSIGTYSELQATLIRWLHRSDLTDLVADFVTLAESGLNRLLTLCAMEQQDQLVMTPGARFVAAPSGMGKPIALWLETVNRPKLQPVLPENLRVDLNSGAPDQWAIDGSRLAFNRQADQPYTVSLRYVKKLALSDAAPTNWVLTNHPDVYLYAALLEAAPYMRDDQRQAAWQMRLNDSIQQLKNADNAIRAAAPLTTELPTAYSGMNWRA